MPVLPYKGFDAYYELSGDPGAPLMVFVNGLTMRAGHWASYAASLAAAGYRTLTFDLLGQGMSAKPILQLRFEENEDLLIALLDHLEVPQAYVCGISYGGVIVLECAIRFPERIKGIIPMSTFSEMDATLWRVSRQLYDSMVRGSFESLLNWFATFNFSPQRLAAVSEQFDATRRINAAANDVYAIQNLMESLKTFQGFTKELIKITCPTLILNGEFDSLTPRRLHEPLRAHIAASRLMLIQHGYHAFSMELPRIVERIVIDFMRQVEAGDWVGDQTVWVAEDDAAAPRIAFPCPGDHTRGIPVSTPIRTDAPAFYSPADRGAEPARHATVR
jgi:pimeloyl-ACP methyl ester carboxylesterase